MTLPSGSILKWYPSIQRISSSLGPRITFYRTPHHKKETVANAGTRLLKRERGGATPRDSARARLQNATAQANAKAGAFGAHIAAASFDDGYVRNFCVSSARLTQDIAWHGAAGGEGHTERSQVGAYAAATTAIASSGTGCGRDFGH